MERTRREAAATLLAAMATALVPARARGQALTPPAGASAVEPPSEPGKVDGSHDAFDHMTAPVLLNGQGPYTFVVDTGASMSCISQTLAEALGLPVQPARPVHTMVGVRLQPLALIEELRIGVRRQKRAAALAIPIEEPGVQGVLAVDWLKGQRVTLDFARNVLAFAPSREETSAPGQIVVPARRRLGQLTIVDADLGEHRVSAMIDSGSEASLCNAPLMRLLDHPLPRGARPDLVQMISIIGEPFAGELVYLPFLRLGGLQLGNVPVVHSDAHAFEIWGLGDKPAVLLGMDLLRQFRAVSLDFGRSQVRFDLAPQQI